MIQGVHSVSRMTRVADLIRVALVVAAAVFLVAGDVSVALKAVLVLPAAVAARYVRVSPLIDLSFALALAVEVAGTAMATHGLIRWDDRISHLVLPALSGPIVYIALIRLGAIVPGAAAPRRLLGVAVVTATAVLGVGVAWEIVEWAVDGTLGTNFSMGYGDTVGDLVADATAAAATGGAVGLWLWAGARGTTRNPRSPRSETRGRGVRGSRQTPNAARGAHGRGNPLRTPDT